MKPSGVGMNDEDAKFFELRKEGKAYLTKVFTHGSITPERRRLIRSVIEGTERVLLGEVEGAMCSAYQAKSARHRLQLW